EPRSTRVPKLVKSAVTAENLIGFEAKQELVHSPHDGRMRIEGAARETNVGGAVLAGAGHQVLAPPDGADRQNASDGLAISHHVGPHAEILLCASGSETETQENLVDNENDPACGADPAEARKPVGISPLVEVGPARAVDQRGIGRRPGVWMERLER